MALQSRGDLGKEGGGQETDDGGGGGDALSFITITISTSKTQNLHRGRMGGVGAN